MGYQLRPYQSAAEKAVFDSLNRHASTLVVMATGTGKSVLFREVARKWPTGRVIVMAHRDELIQQAAEHIEAATGERPAIEMGEERSQEEGSALLTMRSRVVVTSVQTMSRPNRLCRFDPAAFGLMITDECFPAGTMVDGKPIESIRVGDSVTSVDEATGERFRRKVTRVFANPCPDRLVKVVAAGRSVVCTENHPFLGANGWIKAGELTPEMQIVLEENDNSHTTGLHQLRQDVQSNQDATGRMDSHEAHAGILLQGLCQNHRRQNVVGSDGGNQPQARFQANEGTKPDATGSDSAQSLEGDEGRRAQADGSRRQRAWANEAARDAGERDGLASGMGLPSRAGEVCGLSDQLQIGHCQSADEGLDRGRWPIPFVAGGPACRQEEGRPLVWARVDSVEVCERGDTGGFERLCPNGLVYNLEVEHEHTYVANGFVVHNCHHAVAKSYGKIYSYFRGGNPNWRHLGVTATPSRGDGLAMGKVFESVAFEYGINDAVNDGYLCPVRQRLVVIEGMDLSTVRTVAGDFNQGDLERMLTEEQTDENRSVCNRMAEPIIKECGDHRTLVFCVGVHHARLMSAYLNGIKPKSADWLSGETPKDERRKKIASYKAGETQFLCNCAVLTEGFDAPETTFIVMGRPTKSLTVYMQALGRATRPWPGVVDGPVTPDLRREAIAASPKPHCVVLDFVGNAERFEGQCAVTAADVLGGRYGEAVRKYAKKTEAEEATGADVDAALDRAEAELALLAEETERCRLIQARVAYRTQEVGFGKGGETERREFESGARGEPATSKQQWKLRSLGVSYESARRYTKRQASVVINKLLATQRVAA